MLPDRRRFYAEEVCAVAGVDAPALLEAFARVERERFLGPGPWQVAVAEGLPGRPPYRVTPDANPNHLLHNVAVAIDPARTLNNGHPSSLALWIAALGLRRGERAVHVGCGVGYYTAILAELVADGGRVLAIEVDPPLAERAAASLAPWPWVEVVCADGADLQGPVDAVFVNAGCTHPRPEWLEGLAPGGRLVIPLTAPMPGGSAGMGVGAMVRIGSDGSARVLSRVGIYDCAGARDPADHPAILAFLQALQTGRAHVRSIVHAPHEPGPDCALHTSRYCLSSADPAH